VKFSHFSAFKPVCPLCLRDRSEHHPLVINQVMVEARDGITEGILGCPNPACRCEYPILDGIPIIIADIRGFVSSNILSILDRGELSPAMASLVGDCCGPGSAVDAVRQYLSTYASDHYGDLDPDTADARGADGAAPGSVLRLMDKALSLAPKPMSAPIIDLGCSVGRTTFELARKTDGLVLGVDVNFTMLRLAGRVMDRNEVHYPRRKVGMVYDMHRFPVRFDGSSRVDFWAMDATSIPVGDSAFGSCASLNLIDCVPSPYEHLKSVARIVRPGGMVIMSTPYDWSAAATPPGNWLGGHSQRGDNKGSSEPVLRSLLSGGSHPVAIQELELVAESTNEPWTVRLHDRSVMRYAAHLVVLQVEKP
jgi:SAM-dependent methyltransferase/uncharacterized protein YbaR (Trm112 family)